MKHMGSLHLNEYFIVPFAIDPACMPWYCVYAMVLFAILLFDIVR